MPGKKPNKPTHQVVSETITIDGVTHSSVHKIEINMPEVSKQIEKKYKEVELLQKQKKIIDLIVEKKYAEAKEILTSDAQWKNIYTQYVIYAQICFLELNYDEAYLWLQKGFKVNEKDDVLNDLLAQCAGKMKRITEMRAHYERIPNWKKNSNYLRNTIRFYEEMGLISELPTLFEAFENNLLTTGGLPDPLLMEGIHQALQEQKEQGTEKLLAYYQKVDGVEKKKAAAILANHYYLINDFHNALKYFQEIKPFQDNATYRIFAAATYLAGDHQRSEIAFDLIKTLYAKEGDVARTCAAMLAFSSHPKTLALLDEFDSHFPSIRDELCVARANYYYSFDLTKAIEVLEIGIKKYPYCEDLYYNLVVCYLATNQIAKAKQVLAESESKMPEFTRLHTRLAANITSPVATFYSLFREEHKLYKTLKVAWPEELNKAFDKVATAGYPAFLQGSALYNVIANHCKTKAISTVSDWNFLVLCDDVKTLTLEGFEKISETEFKLKVDRKWLNVRLMSQTDYRYHVLSCQGRIPFTMLLGERDGNVIDPSGLGILDIQHGFIRVIGQASDILEKEPHQQQIIQRYLLENFEIEPSLKKVLLLGQKKPQLVATVAVQPTPVDKDIPEIKPATPLPPTLESEEMKVAISEVDKALTQLQSVDFKQTSFQAPYSSAALPEQVAPTSSNYPTSHFFDFEMTGLHSFQAGPMKIIREMLSYRTYDDVDYPYFPNDHIVLADAYLFVQNIYQKEGQTYLIDQYNVRYPIHSDGMTTLYTDKDRNIRPTNKMIYCSHFGMFAQLHSLQNKQVKPDEDPVIGRRFLRSSH